MSLNRLQIGVRIRNIRENIYKETRAVFAERCGLTESHMGQIERGVILPSLQALDKICCICGADLNYILYGKKENNNIRKTLDIYLDRSTNEELKMYFKCIASIKNYCYNIDEK